MIIDGHVHIGTGKFFHMKADADFLVRLADELGFDKLFVTELECAVLRHERGQRRAGPARSPRIPTG